MPILNSAQEFVQNEYDYVVVGGGTAGLVVSTRLAEDKSLKIAVIEAGPDGLADPRIFTPGLAGSIIGDPNLDWRFATVPQEGFGGRVLPQPRGKVLGGSSAMNWMVFSRAPKEEYDAFETVGNDGWNWEAFQKYIAKSEAFTARPPSDKDAMRTGEAGLHGTTGPIKKSYPSWCSDVQGPFMETLDGLGVPILRDATSGTLVGVHPMVGGMSVEDGKRSYARHYYNNDVHTNVYILTEAHASRVILEEGSSGDYLATGVEFVKDGNTNVVKAKREVILSAGALETPRILESSGIGSSKVLTAAGVPVKIDLPGVGENLQDHPLAPSVFEIKADHETLDDMRLNPEVAKAQGELYATAGQGMLSTTFTALAWLASQNYIDPEQLEKYKKILDEQKDTEAWNVSGLRKKQWQLHRDWIDNKNIPTGELLPWLGLNPAAPLKPKPDSKYISLVWVLMHPLSRGTVHITPPSADSPSSPLPHSAAIDPRYLTNPLDVEMLRDGMKYMQKLTQTSPLKESVVECSVPPMVPQTDEQWEGFLRAATGIIFHPIGTAAMASREDEGVVDSNLKVHGTSNLRIADASVIPFQMASHTMSIVYAIGEKAADIIKGASA